METLGREQKKIQKCFVCNKEGAQLNLEERDIINGDFGWSIYFFEYGSVCINACFTPFRKGTPQGRPRSK
jgi:hypothetical protein